MEDLAGVAVGQGVPELVAPGLVDVARKIHCPRCSE
jgi:hypothetical protein